MTKWFRFEQNNSGGVFNEHMGYAIYVEAATSAEANARAEIFGVYFDGVRNGSDCPCCGDRWSKQWSTDSGNTLEEVKAEIARYKYYADQWGFENKFAPYGATDLIDYKTAIKTILA